METNLRVVMNCLASSLFACARAYSACSSFVLIVCARVSFLSSHFRFANLVVHSFVCSKRQQLTFAMPCSNSCLCGYCAQVALWFMSACVFKAFYFPPGDLQYNTLGALNTSETHFALKWAIPYWVTLYSVVAIRLPLRRTFFVFLF